MAKRKETEKKKLSSTNTPVKLTANEFIGIILGDFENNEVYKHYYNNIENNIIVIENSEIDISEDIKISNKSKIYGFTLKNSKIGNIQLTNCTVLGDITFDKKSSGEDISFHFSCDIKGLYIIDKSEVKSIILSSSDINNINISIAKTSNIAIWGSSTCKGLKITESVTGLIGFGGNGGKTSDEKNEIGGIEIDLNSKTNGINVKNSEIGIIWIGNESSIEFLEAFQSRVGSMSYESKKNIRLLIRNCTFNGIELKNSYILKDSFVQIIETQLNKVLIENFQNLGVMTFTNVSPTKICLVSKYNEGIITNSTESRPTKFSIVNSDIGKAQFISADLGSFDTFEFANSKITESYFAGGTLPINTITTRQGYNNQEQKRIVFGQLKKVFDNRGDNVTAIEFQSKEMNAYLKQLLPQITKPSRWGEIFNVLMSRISSNFGQSWELGATMTILVMGIS